MKIDPNTGTIKLSRHTLSPSTHLGDLKDVNCNNLQKGWICCKIESEKQQLITLWFFKKKLSYIEVLFEIEGETIDDWNEQHEILRKSMHDKWLKKELGNAPYDFTWGSVRSLYDRKSMYSTILVGYNANQPDVP